MFDSCWDAGEIRKTITKIFRDKLRKDKGLEAEAAKRDQAEADVVEARVRLTDAEAAVEKAEAAGEEEIRMHHARAAVRRAKKELEDAEQFKAKVQPKWLNMSIACLDGFADELEARIRQAEDAVKKADKKKQAKLAKDRAIEAFKITKSQIVAFLDVSVVLLSLCV